MPVGHSAGKSFFRSDKGTKNFGNGRAPISKPHLQSQVLITPWLRLDRGGSCSFPQNAARQFLHSCMSASFPFADMESTERSGQIICPSGFWTPLTSVQSLSSICPLSTPHGISLIRFPSIRFPFCQAGDSFRRLDSSVFPIRELLCLICLFCLGICSRCILRV